ncbi:Uncharacterized protein AO441_003831 [Nakaseomyces glabratus]|uniref:Uncharacterized protein n=1 Tax=Candida glabrata TaxID=5478 RepID=A0A0W0DL41_CANGB|nr:Uncharacterized protein AO440_004542 [Nakaseomyces glabratus]KTB08581.1 Uncharacterized protein AO441_003831 [Nakaseomyces glabratus]KTB09695.1 Uncharacterized protein AO439_003962 [Nakaseomyces glabratus]KTB12530.1 Uncharacterized protein AO440_004464 [Nakaseomyces glabratus]KTB19359.1 Uncharacterized protein AO438_003987 [Nakaseomyces glabratus]
MLWLVFLLFVKVIGAFPTEQFFSTSEYAASLELRPIKLGKINFLHTTDTHGWLGSHLLQRDFNADWGDFISFVELFRKNRINSKNQDLIVLDTGDKRDGNGLSDATSLVGMNSSVIFNEMDFDLLTLGNHELYTEEASILEYYGTALSGKFKDKYVSSNVEFIDDKGSKHAFGNKYLCFKTTNTKTKILALSFIFDFRRYNRKTIVTPAIQEIKKPWFSDMVKSYTEDDIDMVLVFGHIPARGEADDELLSIHKELRKYYPNIVIQYFGGHTHIRDFKIMDDKSTCLQSGKFSETVGFLSIDNLDSQNVTFSRRYLDFSKRSFKFHAGVKSLTTTLGDSVSKAISKLRTHLGLNEIIGYVPHTFYMSARPLNSSENIYNLLSTKVLPLLETPKGSFSHSRIIMINSGSVRYDLYKGPFTKDTEYIVMPFPNFWKYIRLPLKVAIQIEPALNNGPVIAHLVPPEGRVGSKLVASSQKCPFVTNPKLSEGFTTVDDAGCDGDDTPHRSQYYHDIPNVVQCIQVHDEEPDTIVDFIYYSFMEDSVITVINFILGQLEGEDHKNVTRGDTLHYGGRATKELLKAYIKSI